MTEDECPRRLYLCDIPQGNGLFPLKLKIGETLGDKDALQTIEFVRGEEGTRVEGAAEILLKNDQYVKLLKDRGLKIKHRGKFIDLNITDSLPENKTERSRTTDIEESNEGPSQPSPTQRKFSKDRPIPAPRSPKSSYQEDEVQRLQRRIECRNVPLHMFHRKNMFDHFKQYGNIEDLFVPNYLERNRPPFVKVKYRDHESARRALLEGWNVHAFGHKMYISWDLTEASQVRHRLGMELNNNRGQVRDRTREKQANNRGQVRDRTRGEQANNCGRGRGRRSTSEEPVLTHEKTIATTERSSMPKRKEQPTRSRATSSSSTSSERQSRDRNISSPTKRQPTASRDQDDIKVYDWFDILQENCELFQEGAGNRCVLLQTNRVDKVDEVEEYFRENHYVNIEHTYPMPDGILLVFDSEDGADEAVIAKSINIDEEKMNIVAKTVPGMFRDRFLLEGTFDDLEAVEALLDFCYKEDDASCHVIELESSAFLVKFSDEVDIDCIVQEIESAELDDYNPKAYGMCRSDCVKLENLPKNVKNDALKLAFQNRKNCGGKVTKVDRNGANTSAIVYFADCEDAEKVYEKVSKDGLQIKNKPVEVSLYFRNIVEAEDKRDDSDESADSVDFVESKPKANKSSSASEQNVDGPCCNPQKEERAPKSQDPNEPRDTAESSKGKCAPKTTRCAQRKQTVVKEFRVTPQVDRDVIKYVRKSKKGFDKLHDDLEAMCELEVVERMNDVSFCFRPSVEELDEDIKYNQEEFEERCTLIMDEFFKKFCTKSATYDATNLMNLRTTMSWKEDHEYLRVNVEKEKGVDVYIRRAANNQGQVVVTGIDDEVADVLQFIKRKCDVTEQSMNLPTNNFRALRECNVIKRIDQEFQHDAEIRAEETGDKQGLIKFKGPRSNVEEAKTKLTNGMMELTTRTLPNMGSRSEYLLTSLKSEVDGLQPGAVDVRQIIQSQFGSDKIYASLQLNNDEVCIKYCDASELEKAQTSLAEIVEQKTIPVKEGFQELISTPEWKRLIQNASSSGAVQVYVNVPKSSIDVVGLIQAFHQAYNDVSKYISENVVVTKSFSGSSYVIKYLQDHLKSHKDSSKKLKEVRLDFKPDESVVFVKGKIRYAMDVELWLEEVASELTFVEKSIQNPGMPGYFRGRRGREQIETIATKNHCIGVIDSQDEDSASSSSAAQTELSANISQVPTSNPAPATVNLTTIQVIVKQGDITTTSSPAIVNSTSQFTLSGKVGKALVAKAGQGIVQEWVTNPISHTNSMRVTTGGSLCQYILHIDTPNDPNQLENVLIDCFTEADRLGVNSLAVPPVGTGGIGLSSPVVAKTFASAIDKFDKTNPRNLQKIKVFVFQGNMLSDFQETLLNQPSQRKSQSQPKPPSIIPKQGTSFERDAVRILFCSWNKNDVEKAFEAVQDVVGELSATKVIKNEVIGDLRPEVQQELMDLTKRENVLIEQTSNKELTIKGLRPNVLEAYTQANDIIHQFKQALHISEYVMWKYDDQNGSQGEFSLRANYQLEEAYKKDEKGKTKVTAMERGTKLQYAVDFSKMEAYTRNFTYKLEKKVISSIVDNPLPQTWDDIGNQMWKQVAVPANSFEYNRMVTRFTSLLGVTQIISLHRIQNPTLWRQFQAQKRKIEKKLQSKHVTRELYHGTAGSTCTSICKNGFDRSYAGKNGTAYGRGVYFATTAQYSADYTTPDGRGLRCMILAEVVTGKYCAGNSSLNVIPMQNDGSPYDSVVNDTRNPTIFVVFRDASVYPLYIFTYK